MKKIVLIAAARVVAASGSAFAANQKPRPHTQQAVEQVDTSTTASTSQMYATPRVSPTDRDPFKIPDAGYGQGIWGN